MLSVIRRLSSFLKYHSKEDLQLSTSIKTIVGKRPYNLHLFHLAMRHSSMASQNKHGFRESNERLEYLGDAVLGLIVAELLFIKFPYKDEGFLTEMRSKMVNRESLNQIGRKLGLKNLINYNQASRSSVSHKSMYGDSLEALIGAVYLDFGYKYCKKFVVERLIFQHFDLDDLIHAKHNFKSLIIEYAQKSNLSIEFIVHESGASNKVKQFEAEVMIDNELSAKGYGLSKKKAEQDAAQKTCELLNIG